MVDALGRWWWRGRSAVDGVLESHPADQHRRESHVEEAFIRDGQDDKGRGAGEEDDEQPMEVVRVRLVAGYKLIGQRHQKRQHKDNPAYDLVASRKALFGLQRECAGARDNHGQGCEANLDAHKGAGEVILRWRGLFGRAGEVGEDIVFKHQINKADKNHNTATANTDEGSVSLKKGLEGGIRTFD